MRDTKDTILSFILFTLYSVCEEGRNYLYGFSVGKNGYTLLCALGLTYYLAHGKAIRKYLGIKEGIGFIWDKKKSHF